MAKAKKAVKAKKKTSVKKPLKKVVKKKASSRKVKKTSVKRKSKKVAFIPKGYNSVTPYLIIENAAKAIEFYKDVFGAKEKMRMGRDGNKVGHAELQIGDAKIMLADECPEMNANGPKTFNGSPVSIHVYIKDVDNVVNRAVSLGANLIRPVENMFYGDRAGGFEDPFGHKWFVATHVEDLTPAQIRKRSAEMFG